MCLYLNNILHTQTSTTTPTKFRKLNIQLLNDKLIKFRLYYKMILISVGFLYSQTV